MALSIRTLNRMATYRKTPVRMTLSIVTFNTITLSRMTPRITILSRTLNRMHTAEWHSAEL